MALIAARPGPGVVLDLTDAPSSPEAPPAAYKGPLYSSRPLPEYVSADDYHEGLKQIRAHLGRDCGFGIAISRTKSYTPTKTGEKRITRVMLQCARSKEYKSKGIGHKVYATRMTGCPWRAKMQPHPGGGWKITGVCMDHNHELNDVLDDKGMPPRARTTPAAQRRKPAALNEPTFTPPAPANYVPPPAHSPATTTWPTMTASGIRRAIVPMQQRLLSISRTQFPMDQPMFLVYSDHFQSILGAHADLKVALEEEFPFAYQGGVYTPAHDVLYVTSNQYSLPTGQDKVAIVSKVTRNLYGQWSRHQVPNQVRNPAGGAAYSDGVLDGVLFCAQGDMESPTGLVHMEADYPFRVRTLVNNFYGRRFNSLKDVAIHSDGSIYFTDPVYGHDQGTRPPPELPNQVYRFDPHTGDVRVVADRFGRPSGICFSPKEGTCYISDTEFIHGNGHVDFERASTIYAYDVGDRAQSKFLMNRRVFAMADVGVPDGLKCDLAGNVYAACGDGLSVWSPGGVLLGKVLVPGGLANFSFGRKGELFLLNGKKLWILKVADTVKGALVNREALRYEEVE
ncbi:hypothetical protein EKO04_000583 [Ascochyta lentis]|uniref:SMP-30/Gluconolactonase/LRE-like region domain-containing protein n=1 Tax=Ascochyta lentis TaxID=205686 RepID=A0A8H7JE78_9PLEO|nr:hypothetical protein EKO04_000583 [Ascochyta lentis]